jgi:hypothetical protein
MNIELLGNYGNVKAMGLILFSKICYVSVKLQFLIFKNSLFSLKNHIFTKEFFLKIAALSVQE